MRVRELALVAVAIAVVVHVRCGGHDAAPAAASSATAAPARSARPNPFAAVALAAASSRVHRIDIRAGEARLEGQAVDEHEQPIGGATVTLNGDRTATTEADGSFVFEGVALGDYHLAAAKGPAYGDDDYSLTERSDPEIITLRVGPTIVFHVADRAGSPVLGATVSTSHHSDAFTDRDGVVRFRGMELGDDRFDVVAIGFASQRVKVAAGDDPSRTIDQKVVLGPSAPLGGVVIDQDGTPVADAHVIVQTTTRSWMDTARSDGQGRWQVTGFAGRVVASASDDVNISTGDQIVELDGASAKLDVVLRVERGATVGGTVVDEHGKPVAGIHVSAGMSVADSDAHGRFLVTGIEPGDVQVAASGDRQGSAIQAIKIARGAHAEVALVIHDSSIAGTVTDARGEPIADAAVSADGPTDSYNRTDELGRFDFGGLPPGDYKVSASRDGDKADAANAVVVHSGNRGVALVVPDESSVTGRVVLDGQPVDYFGVVVSDTSAVTTDNTTPVRSPDGRFVQGGLRAGTWTIAVTGPGFESRFLHDVVVPDGKQLDLGDIVVDPGKRVRGHVVDASGVPVANAVVVVSTNANVQTAVDLGDAFMGRYGARSDASGYFEIGGLPDDLPDATIQASDPEVGIALPRPLAPGELDAEVVLALAATGSISGVVVNAKPDEVDHAYVVALADNRSYFSLVEAGEFAVGQLPVGDYLVTIRGTAVMPPVQVHVAANAATQVTVHLPEAPITLDVDVEDGACTGVIVTSADALDVMMTPSLWTELARCTDAHHAVIAGVAPGRYQLCNVDCTTVELTPSPAEQHATINAAGSADPAADPDPDPSPSPEPEANPAPEPDEAGSSAG